MMAFNKSNKDKRDIKFGFVIVFECGIFLKTHQQDIVEGARSQYISFHILQKLIYINIDSKNVIAKLIFIHVCYFIMLFGTLCLKEVSLIKNRYHILTFQKNA